jgi:XTP/dITP diphosphohydrolase
MLKTLILATHNKGKAKEFAVLLDGLVSEVKTAGELGLASPDETGTTFRENATIKALAAMKATGLPALADDSGLCVKALDGEPGVYSADWAPGGDFAMAMKRVHDEMGDATDRGAHFIICLALALPDGHVELFEESQHGEIVWPPRGEGGFGYDPIFIPEGRTETFSEMGIEEKSKISHRRKAVERLKHYLSQGEKR